MNSIRRRIAAPCVLYAFFVVFMGLSSPAGAQIKLIKGQTVYVPAYSDIYQGDREQPFYLAVTLSIRNTDPSHPITLLSVDYHDDKGKLVRSYVKQETTIATMVSVHFFVKESDRAGGAGAKFIVKWKSNTNAVAPIIETIMIGTNTQQGISFTSRGQAIQEQSE